MVATATATTAAAARAHADARLKGMLAPLRAGDASPRTQSQNRTTLSGSPLTAEGPLPSASSSALVVSALAPVKGDSAAAADEPAEEESFFQIAEDDADAHAQSFMQPAISPLAARLALPSTPAAEKAAAMDRGGGYFSADGDGGSEAISGGGEEKVHGKGTATPASMPQQQATTKAATFPVANPGGKPGRRAMFEWPISTGPAGTRSPPIRPGLRAKLSKSDSHSWAKSLDIPDSRHAGQAIPAPEANHLPSPWQTASPQQPMAVATSNHHPSQQTHPRTFSGAFGGHQRGHQRSTSLINGDALKKLSKALPSISIPSGGIMANVATPTSFFSFSSGDSSPRKDDPSSSTRSQSPLGPRSPSRSPRGESNRFSFHLDRETRPPAPPRASLHTESPRQSSSSQTGPDEIPWPPSDLRRMTSDESLLYHTLSRTPSFGDSETRFAHVREQVNSRVKAIKDSWDVPTFKIPHLSLPYILNPPLRKTSEQPSLAPQAASQRNGLRGVADSHPPASIFDELEGDIVVMGGYRGSVLRSAQPPYQQLWVPIKVGLNMRKVNLAVGLDLEDEETMEQRIRPSGMLQNIGPVDIARRFFKRLRETEKARSGKLRIHDFGYDWRLSPARLSRQIVRFLEGLPCNQPGVPAERRGALVVAHSLGGILTRHAVNMRPELFSGVVFAGAPQRCTSILGPLRNGDAVLLNEKVLTAQVNFSLRSTFVFLPEDGLCFVDKVTKEEMPIDFYNVDDWIRYRLSPCVADPPLAPATTKASTKLDTLRSLSSSLPSLPKLRDSFPGLPLRGRSHSQAKKADATRGAEMTAGGASIPAPAVNIAGQDLATQIGSSPSASGGGASSSASRRDSATLLLSSSASIDSDNSHDSSSHGSSHVSTKPAHAAATAATTLERNRAYLARTLAETRQFRQELLFRPSQRDAYPPFATVYAKDIPTAYRAQVTGGREAIARADVFDDLVFRGGDGVVLAREAMLPAGYELAKGGCVLTDRGHITLLGDLRAMEQALGAVVRGRRKGIGLVIGLGARGSRGKGKESEARRGGDDGGLGRDTKWADGDGVVGSAER